MKPRLMETAAAPLLTVLCLYLWLGQEAGGFIADCTGIKCPPPLCANAITPPGQCCLSCETSNCFFEGCVVFERFDVHWKPNPCTRCTCVNNEVACTTKLNCTKLTTEDCFGHKVITKPNECCPSCDYDIPENKCEVIPSRYSTLRVGDGELCAKKVMRYKCDKPGFVYKGRKYRCVPQEQVKVAKFLPSCPFLVMTYLNVTSCRAVPDERVKLSGYTDEKCDMII